MIWMIAASEARSTSDTRSLRLLWRTVSTSRLSAAWLMMRPARRAAFTAMLIKGWFSAISCPQPRIASHGIKSEAGILIDATILGRQRIPGRLAVAGARGAVPDQPPREHRRVCAGDEDDGIAAPVPRRTEALPARRSRCDGFARHRHPGVGARMHDA